MLPANPRLSKLRLTAAAISAVLLLANHIPQAAAREGITASITPAYYTGKYNTNSNTDVLYVPLAFKYETGNVYLKVTVPYIRVHSQQGVIIVGGIVVGTGGVPTTQSGLGDIWLEGRYRIKLDNKGNSVSPYVKIKLGTASQAKGLGTGANDIEFGGWFRTRIGKRFFPFAQLGYRIHGQTTGIVLNDYMTYMAGSSYIVNADNIATLLWAGHQSAQPGLQAASTIIGAWNVRVRRDSDLQVFGLFGLSNGSPDYGGGLSYMYHF